MTKFNKGDCVIMRTGERATVVSVEGELVNLQIEDGPLMATWIGAIKELESNDNNDEDS